MHRVDDVVVITVNAPESDPNLCNIQPPGNSTDLELDLKFCVTSNNKIAMQSVWAKILFIFCCQELHHLCYVPQLIIVITNDAMTKVLLRFRCDVPSESTVSLIAQVSLKNEILDDFHVWPRMLTSLEYGHYKQNAWIRVKCITGLTLLASIIPPPPVLSLEFGV